MSKINDVEIEDLKVLVAESSSISELMRKLGYKVKGGNAWVATDKRLKELNLDTSHFKKKGEGDTSKYSLDEILIKDSTYTNLYRLKKRMLKANLMEYKCVNCGISTWLGKEITLELDHINGNNTDHRLENLRLLCPNCHSQTETFSGRNVDHS